MTSSCKRCSLHFRNATALKNHFQRVHKKQKIDTLPSRATSPDACEEHVDHDDDGDFDNFAYEDESLLVNHRFFDYQVGIKRKLRGYQNSVLMPKVKMKDLTFAASDRKIYIAILEYVTKRPQLSEADSTGLIELLKKVSGMSQCGEIALPAK